MRSLLVHQTQKKSVLPPLKILSVRTAAASKDGVNSHQTLDALVKMPALKESTNLTAAVKSVTGNQTGCVRSARRRAANVSRAARKEVTR